MNPETQQEISLLNLRFNDMMLQLNKVIKMLAEENEQLTKENSELKNPKVSSNQPECEVKTNAN
jgi:predicted transcriptional regulator